MFVFVGILREIPEFIVSIFDNRSLEKIGEVRQKTFRCSVA